MLSGDQTDTYNSDLVSQITLAMETGKTAVLQQTSSVHESFYDLFNQHFTPTTNKQLDVLYYANVALGASSRMTLVHNNFRCIVVLSKAALKQTPPPFLNRFEKFLLSPDTMLQRVLSQPNLVPTMTPM